MKIIKIDFKPLTTFLSLLLLLLFTFISCEKYEIESSQPTIFFERSANKESVTVVGYNDPSIDIATVQNAVDNYDNVVLSGVFDFGFDKVTGGVDITRPNVTIQGPATILNGSKSFGIPGWTDWWYTLSIRAPGVEVIGLEIKDSYDTGILVFVGESGKPVVIDGNSIKSYWAAVFAMATKGGLKVVNNTLNANVFGYIARETEGATKISHNEINELEQGYGLRNGINILSFNHKLDINNNTIGSVWFDGIVLGAWSVMAETDPEWGDNPEARIGNNTLQLIDSYASGIMIGSSAYGTDNVLVKDNTLTGLAGYGGLMKQPYGSNNKFINNDLTELTTHSPQIWMLGGEDNQFQNNKLGIVAPFSVGGWGPAFKNTATLVSPINWHLNDLQNTPDPVNHGNHFINNDYSLTGVLGWTDDPEEFGAVLLLDFIQKFLDNPYEEPFIMRNYINERNFPSGSDLCTQVLDLSNLQGNDLIQGTNQIAGWMACEAEAKKATYQLVNDSYKNFGQLLKNVNNKRKKALVNMKH